VLLAMDRDLLSLARHGAQCVTLCAGLGQMTDEGQNPGDPVQLFMVVGVADHINNRKGSDVIAHA